jgi:hypothetical protein
MAVINSRDPSVLVSGPARAKRVGPGVAEQFDFQPSESAIERGAATSLRESQGLHRLD